MGVCDHEVAKELGEPEPLEVTLCYLSLESIYRWDIILSSLKSLMSVWPTGSRRNSDLWLPSPQTL